MIESSESEAVQAEVADNLKLHPIQNPAWSSGESLCMLELAGVLLFGRWGKEFGRNPDFPDIYHNFFMLVCDQARTSVSCAVRCDYDNSENNIAGYKIEADLSNFPKFRVFSLDHFGFVSESVVEFVYLNYRVSIEAGKHGDMIVVRKRTREEAEGIAECRLRVLPDGRFVHPCYDYCLESGWCEFPVIEGRIVRSPCKFLLDSDDILDLPDLDHSDAQRGEPFYVTTELYDVEGSDVDMICERCVACDHPNRNYIFVAKKEVKFVDRHAVRHYRFQATVYGDDAIYRYTSLVADD